MKENTKEKISAMVGLAFVIFGMQMLMGGYHNIDSGHNWAAIENLTGISVCDLDQNGTCLKPDEMIGYGIKQMLIAPFLIMIGGVLVVFDGKQK